MYNAIIGLAPVLSEEKVFLNCPPDLVKVAGSVLRNAITKWEMSKPDSGTTFFRSGGGGGLFARDYL